MARRTHELTIEGKPPFNRDDGKTFLLTEMDSYSGMQWALRAMLALAAAGVNLPVGAEGAGMAGIATIDPEEFKKVNPDVAVYLLNELLDCVKIIPPNRSIKPMEVVRGSSQVEEIRTWMELGMAVLNLHVGFFEGGASPTTAQTSTQPSQKVS